MTERIPSDSARYQARCQTNSEKMSEGDLGTRKTLFVLVVVVGCFAVLWPKVFYPMLVGPTNQRMKPSSLDKGCCDVISDIDVNAIKIMTELCNNIIQQSDEKPLKGQEIISRCRTEVLNKCGIDISAVLQEQVRLGRSFKQIVDEVRSFNGSLCFKYKFGVSPWTFGVSHRVTVNLGPSYIRQERPAHLRPEMLHPALREKGSAISQPYHPPGKGSQPKFVDGRPGPVPGVRPPMGGAGHVVHPQQKGLNSMGVIMPIYTIGIVIFFSYTLMKLLFKKKPDGPGGNLYPPVEPSMTFRREVFESQKSRTPHGPSIVNAMSALLDEVDQELEARRKANEAAASQKEKEEPTSNGTLLANGSAKHQQEHDQPSVKVLGMEMTASCEGGEKWSRPESPVIPSSPPPPPEPVEPPQEIYLEGALPAQSQLLVADSTTETETNASIADSAADPAVVLASKMTLSVISLDSQENENEIEPIERSKLRNGEIDDIEHENIDDENVDESKYTTASGATAAEREISEGERTDGEEEMEDDMAKIPEFVVDNGVQQLEDIEDLHDDADAELQKLAENEESGDVLQSNVEDVNQSETSVRVSEDVEQNINLSPEIIEGISNVIDNVISTETRLSEIRSSWDMDDIGAEEHEPAVKFNERIVIDEDEPLEEGMSVEDIEHISDVIDDVINVGTRMSEMISAEEEAEVDESFEQEAVDVKLSEKVEVMETKKEDKPSIKKDVKIEEKKKIELESDEEEIEIEVTDDEEDVEIVVVEVTDSEEEEEEVPKRKPRSTEKVVRNEQSNTEIETKPDSVNG